MIVLILLAIVVAIALSYVIVKFLPLKLRWVASLVLLIAAVFLVYKIYDGVMKPINFDKKKTKRFAQVIKNLKIIRDAEVAYYEVNGDYTKDKAALIRFIDTAQRAIVETRDTVVKVNKGSKWQPVMVDVEKRVKDTIGYEPILDDFKDRDYKNMFIVPGVDGKEFELEIGKVEKVQGLEVPVFEAKTGKADILKGMDASLIKQELEAVTTDEIKGEYISVGSLTEVTTGGNWPPSYDKGNAAKKDN
ncbi:hypothetical protein AAON49_01810 [Pseudotenacibaculum sp. MALMAid0570]|mgnify:CR=1 FL=1|uniref:hypothetical protein n=1 Tax=Pseudotenacibaculum sp. MALMAid0570 TaxID=3143938 RepID=UPI0032DEC65C